MQQRFPRRLPGPFVRRKFPARGWWTSSVHESRARGSGAPAAPWGSAWAPAGQPLADQSHAGGEHAAHVPPDVSPHPRPPSWGPHGRAPTSGPSSRGPHSSPALTFDTVYIRDLGGLTPGPTGPTLGRREGTTGGPRRREGGWGAASG